MATIVQPYNPWREQLALTALGNIAGDIIGDMWKTHRQNEQNKKINAFRGELQNLAQQQQGNISLAQPQAPQGYNSNPWANALHQTYSPLTQFDIGTAGIGKTPSLQDIARNADTLAASKRFSMLSPETVQGVKNSMMQNAIASLFGNASDIEGRMNALTMGAANGVVAPQVLTAYSPFAGKVYSPFTFDVSDLGKSKDVIALNSHTGQANTALSMPVTVSPNEAARNAASIQAANINANAHIFGSKSAAEMKKQELQLEQYKQAIADYDSQLKGIDDDITAHLAVMDTLPTDEARAAYRLSVIAPLEQDKARITAERNEAQARYRNALGFGTGAGQSGMATQTGKKTLSSVWGDLFGNPQGFTISNNGHFGAFRKNHPQTPHQGIDLWFKDINGRDIPFDKRFGDEAVVQEAGSIRGYGNAVYIRTKRNGQTVEYRFGHLQDGSIKFKKGQKINPGDIIGKVGNTGISSGPHLHVEVRVGDENGNNMKPVDPTAFFEDFPLQQNTPNVTAISNLQPQQQNTTQTTQQVKGSNSTAANQGGVPYLVKDGDMLTIEAFDKIREEGNYDPETLFNILTEQKGWQLATSQSTPKVTAVNEHTPQNITNTEPVTQTKQSPPKNWPFALPGRPQYPQGWNFSDSVNWINAHHNNENPFGRPDIPADNTPINSVPPEPVSTGANPWEYLPNEVPRNFDLNTPILRGGQRQQPLPSQPVSDDSRNTPIFTGNFADMISDAVSGWGLTQGDNTIPDSKNIPNANPILDFLLKNYRNYPHLPFQNWPIGAGYDAQQIQDWINSHQYNENPYWGHYQPTLSPQKLPIRGKPVNSGANPWSYVQEQNYYPFWRLAEWLDNGALNDNDISPLYPLSSPSTHSNYNNAAAKVLWNLIQRKR